jgi:hypothetical protein
MTTPTTVENRLTKQTLTGTGSSREKSVLVLVRAGAIR